MGCALKRACNGVVAPPSAALQESFGNANTSARVGALGAVSNGKDSWSGDVGLIRLYPG